MKKLKQHWTNDDNFEFYVNTPMSNVHDLTKIGGLDNGCDIAPLEKYIIKANSILEVGAWYGRVLKKILDIGYKGKLYALDRVKHLCEFIRANFKDKVTVIEADLRNFHYKSKFDLILWMWVGIYEFNKSEQLSVLANLANHLNDNGILVIESMFIKPLNVSYYSNQEMLMETKCGNVYAYVPSVKELYEYAHGLNFEIIDVINYKTATDRERVIFVWKKKS